MSGIARNDLFKKQAAVEKTGVVVVTTDTVSCSNDHPKVYYKLQNNEAVCEYCSRRFVYVNRT